MNKTNINFKVKNKPRTVVEKYNFLKDKNQSLEDLKKVLDLEIEF